jgi:3-phenylpropionate/trans-cinnamate dioxygenase ferredoxin reductase subunit
VVTTPKTFVIVGGSLAGASAAHALRAEGFDGRVVLLGEEPELPYERPPLSKGYLSGETPRGDVYVHQQSFYAANAIDLRTGVRVAAVDRSAAQVVLESDERVPFDALLLATGASPRHLQVPGADLDGIFYLRELTDADALRERVGRGGKLVVVGAGWIGSEVAASARQQGVDVTVLDPEAVPLARVLGPDVGGFYRDLHASRGVELLMRTGVASFEGSGQVHRVVTTDGQRIDTDFVVVGIGVQPRTELADAAGLTVDNGIVTDELLRSSDPRIFAAGDVARARHPFYQDHVRVEHWATARDQGAAAGRNMLGRGEPYDKLPYFFSEQYDAGMEYRGWAPQWDQVVFRGDPRGGQFLAFWLKDRRVLAGMNVNIWGVGDDVESLIRSRTEVDRSRLADLDVPLTDVSAQPVADANKAARGGLAGFVAGRVNFVRRFVTDRMTPADATPAEELARGEGRVLDIDGEKVAVYKDEAGDLHGVSPVCTHARCLVQWNADDRAWDCPCHGSRFDHTGQVLRGPAKKNLERKRVPISLPRTGTP